MEKSTIIGKKVKKKSGKPFKSGLKIATVKDIVVNEKDPKKRLAYVLEEDDSIVNVDQCYEVEEKFYKKFTEFLNNGGVHALFIIAVVAIVFAIIGFHGQHKFNIWWFIFFELPLYLFCGWALWKALKMYQMK